MANHLLDAVVGEESIPNGASRSSRAASPNGEGITQPGHYLGPTSTFSVSILSVEFIRALIDTI